MNLYQLSVRYEQLLDQDEYTDEEMQELEALHDDFEDECISRGKYILNKKAELKAIETAIIDMQARAAKLETKIESSETTMLLRMNVCGVTKITKCPLFPITIKRNPHHVEVFDQDSVPPNFFYTYNPAPMIKVDKKLIKETIENGIMVTGARLVSKHKISFK